MGKHSEQRRSKLTVYTSKASSSAKFKRKFYTSTIKLLNEKNWMTLVNCDVYGTIFSWLQSFTFLNFKTSYVTIWFHTCYLYNIYNSSPSWYQTIGLLLVSVFKDIIVCIF